MPEQKPLETIAEEAPPKLFKMRDLIPGVGITIQAVRTLDCPLDIMFSDKPSRGWRYNLKAFAVTYCLSAYNVVGAVGVSLLYDYSSK